MQNEILKLGKYRHYKGLDVEVIGVAHHSETMEEMAVYRHIGKSPIGENDLWVRPLKMFMEEVEKDGKKMPRFEYVGE